VVAVGVLPLRGLLHYQGPPMEEGFMLVFGEQVLHGARANQDFLHLYGPGSLWVLAAVYRVFGVTLTVERMVGLAQIAGIVSAVYVLGRSWGRRIAVLCALTSLLLILPPVGLTAMAWNGAIALGAWAVVVADRARRHEDARRARRLHVVAGLLAGLALLYRPDLVLALALATVALLLPDRGRTAEGGTSIAARARWLAAGTAIGVAPYVVHVAMVGVGRAFTGMVVDPIVHLRGGRSLPVPPSWDRLDGFLQRAGGLRAIHWPLPALAVPHQIFLWFFTLLVVALGGLGLAVARVRRAPDDRRARTLVVASAFAAGLLTQALQRPDTAHLAWVSCIAIALLPAYVAELWRARDERGTNRAWLPAAGCVALFVLVIAPQFTARGYLDLSEQTFGHNVFGVAITRGDRTFYYGDAAPAHAAQRLVDDLGAQLQPGQRLFVGPFDLRQTPYSDAFFYYLFPELHPSTYFIEMDPGIANAKGSRLTSDVASSDWLILSNVWSGWDEPNDSRVVGPSAPNDEVARSFCLVHDYDNLFRLYHRCGP